MRPGVPSVWILAGVLSFAPATGQPGAAVPTAVERIGKDVLGARAEKLAPDRARIVITPKRGNGSRFKLLDDGGKEIATAISGTGAIEAMVDPRRAHVWVPSTPPPPRPLPAEGLEFSARYVTITPQGTTALGGLFLRPARVPLTWNDSSRAYATELLVGYEFLDGAERPLAAPKTVTFFVEGSHARIEADTVVVKNSGGSGYQRVTLRTGQIDGDTSFVARAGPNDELKSSVAVHREPGALALSLPTTHLPAFGVGSGTLAISLLARDGLPLALSMPLEVQLSSRSLRQPSIVTLPAGKNSVEVDVRSAGYGADEIAAQAGNLRASIPVELVFPMAALLAALGGGSLGGAARHLRSRRRQTALLGRRMIEGVLVGVIFVGAAWAGLVAMDASTGVLGTPFGAFVFAALSGYVGTALLDRVVTKTFGGLTTT